MNVLPTELHLLRPLWLLLLIAVPMVWWALARTQRDGGDWTRACDPHLLPHLLEARSGRASRAPQWLGSAALVLATLALAGPAWERLPESLQRQEAALVLVLDLSPSTRATDLKPDRLARARFKLADLFRVRPDGQTALVVYAGEAFTVAPLTDDSNTIANLVEALDPGLMPVDGKRADLALRHAERLLRGAGLERGEILLITDRSEARDQAVAAELATRGLRVSVLGLGGPSAAPVPLPTGGFLLDGHGKPVLARLDSASLRALAAAGGGRFSAFSSDTSDLLALGLDQVRGTSLRDSQAQSLRYRDAGFWLLPPLALLVLLAFRRGWLAILLLMPIATPPAYALEWRDLWQRPDQQAAQALRDGDAARAQALARDPDLRGAAAYRGEQWDDAIEAFSHSQDAVAHYNRGNALARARRYDDAMDAYESALRQQPEMAQAQANLDAVRTWLEQQPQQQNAGEGESGEDQARDAGEQEPSSESDPSQSSESSAGQDEPQDRGAESEAGERGESEGDPEADPSQHGQPSSGSDASEPEQSAAPDESLDPQDPSQQALSQAIDQAMAEQTEAEQPETDPASRPQALSAEEQADAERRQSVEQWLRRVPDDPGALLRRKFVLEHQRRLREGSE